MILRVTSVGTDGLPAATSFAYHHAYQVLVIAHSLQQWHVKNRSEPPLYNNCCCWLVVVLLQRVDRRYPLMTRNPPLTGSQTSVDPRQKTTMGYRKLGNLAATPRLCLVPCSVQRTVGRLGLQGPPPCHHPDTVYCLQRFSFRRRGHNKKDQKTWTSQLEMGTGRDFSKKLEKRIGGVIFKRKKKRFNRYFSAGFNRLTENKLNRLFSGKASITLKTRLVFHQVAPCGVLTSKCMFGSVRKQFVFLRCIVSCFD